MTTDADKPTCKFCGKTFIREKTMFVHLCEKKRRHKQRVDKGPQLGLAAFNQFYMSTQGSKPKTYSDFSASPFYKGFVKFGWYVHQIRAVNISGFTKYLIDNNVKLDWWARDRFYEKFIIEYMQRENPMDAITRTIEELTKWGEENDLSFDRFFEVATPNRIASYISNGRLSPWFLFNCDQGIRALGMFTEEQMTLAFKWINPDFWTAKFNANPNDVKWVKEILEDAGFNE